MVLSQLRDFLKRDTSLLPTKQLGCMYVCGVDICEIVDVDVDWMDSKFYFFSFALLQGA